MASNLSDGNKYFSSGSFIEAINCYYELVLNNPQMIKYVSFNLIYSLDRLFGTKMLLDFQLYQNQYKNAPPSVTRNVDIIICVHNAQEDVIRCIASVIATSFGEMNIIIVDDGSDSLTKEFLIKLKSLKFIKLHRNEKAVGYTLAANIGLSLSTREYKTLLNSDTIVTPFWLSSIVTAFSVDTKVGLVGPLSNTASWQSIPDIFDNEGDWASNQLPANLSPAKFASYVRGNSRLLRPSIGFLNGFCLTIKSKLVDDIGVFDEHYFGKGYGEENDYSIRARTNGWLLKVCDDAYVYHSQSKSYSHERRASLSRHAGEMLAEKHGTLLIEDGVRTCHHNLQMVYNQKLASNLIRLEAVKENIKKKYKDKSVAYLLPAGGIGGGSNVIVTEALALHDSGISVSIVNLESNRMGFDKFYSNLPFDVIYIQRPSEMGAIYKKFDLIIATLYRTVYWFDSLLGKEKIPVLAYYVQDYEPNFFSRDSAEFSNACKSYSYHPSIKMFTKSRWNSNTIQNSHGRDVDIIGPSYDINLFYPSPRSTPSPIVTLLAMVRFDTERRAPYNTIQVLHSLYEKYSGSIKIVVFGSERNHPGFDKLRGVDFENLGIIDSRNAATLYRDVDIFIDCSYFQAMGLTALECMASGVAVVGTIHGGMHEFIENGVNGYLVDTHCTDNIVEAVSKLIEDQELRWNFQERGLEVVKYHPIFSAFGMLELMF